MCLIEFYANETWPKIWSTSSSLPKWGLKGQKTAKIAKIPQKSKLTCFIEFHANETWPESWSTSSSLPKWGSILICGSGSSSILTGGCCSGPHGVLPSATSAAQRPVQLPPPMVLYISDKKSIITRGATYCKVTCKKRKTEICFDWPNLFYRVFETDGNSTGYRVSSTGLQN